MHQKAFIQIENKMLVYAVYNEFTANYEQVYLFSKHEPIILIIQDSLSMTAPSIEKTLS